MTTEPESWEATYEAWARPYFADIRTSVEHQVDCKRAFRAGYEAAPPTFVVLADPRDKEIARLRVYIAELEQALKGAVWATERDICQVCASLRATKTEAHILVLLWKARHPVLSETIDLAVPQYVVRPRIDPDSRQPNTIKVLLYHLRRRFGRETVLTAGYNAGYYLGEGMRARLDELLA